MNGLLKQIATVFVLLSLSSAGMVHYYQVHTTQSIPELKRHSSAIQKQEEKRSELDLRIESGIVIPDEDQGVVFYDSESNINVIMSPSSGVSFD